MQRSVIDESSPRAPCRPSAVAALSRTMKKSLGALLVVVVILAVIVLERTFTFRSRQPQTAPVAVEPLDTAALAQRLAGALRCKTISYQDSSQFDAREFEGFQRYLRTTFPKLHAALKLEKVNGYGLLYEWPGSDPSAPPIVLLAHQDVVPVEPGTETRWTEPPFDGRIAGGYVWGRGALDDKGSLVGLCEAVEHLLGAGAKPRRTVYLAFGYDEEVGGRRGAARIADLLASRNVHPEFVLDEGGALTNGLIAGVSAPVAVVGIAEKGYVTVGLTAQAEGGHSSMPPDETAVGILAAAITRLEHHQMPRAIRGPTAAMFDYLGPEMSFAPRLVMANRWLFGGVLARKFGATPQGNAMLRTTTAPTVVQAGRKGNVLPSSARALGDRRILPGARGGGVRGRGADLYQVLEERGVVGAKLRSVDLPTRWRLRGALRCRAGLVRGARDQEPLPPVDLSNDLDREHTGDHSDGADEHPQIGGVDPLEIGAGVSRHERDQHPQHYPGHGHAPPSS